MPDLDRTAIAEAGRRDQALREAAASGCWLDGEDVHGERVERNVSNCARHVWNCRACWPEMWLREHGQWGDGWDALPC